MWTTVLLLALALNFEPNRIGIIGFLLLRAHPIRQLLAFLSTSFFISAATGMAVIFVAQRGSLLQRESSGAVMQIAIGTLALAAAALLMTNIASRRRSDHATAQSSAGGSGDREATELSGVGIVDHFIKRSEKLARGDSLWFAAVLGLGISLPSVDYLALLLLIAASGEPAHVKTAALFTFLVVANAILAIPIVSYVFAKDRTIRALERLRSWILARSRRDYALLLGIAGTLMIAVGLRHL